MAEQTPAANALPFETPVAWVGREGLQLNKAIDDLTMQEVSRIANFYHTGSGLQTRLGQTQLAVIGGTVHAIRRLNNPRLGTFTRFWGAGTSWYRGASGVPTVLDAGLSGNPITLVPVRPPFSGEPYMIMADSNAMRKASGTAGAPSLPLGLPAPGIPTVVVNAGRFRGICGFDSVDGTQAVNWTTYGASTAPGVAQTQATPTLSDVVGFNGDAVSMATYSNVPPTTGEWPTPDKPGDVWGDRA